MTFDQDLLEEWLSCKDRHFKILGSPSGEVAEPFYRSPLSIGDWKATKRPKGFWADQYIGGGGGNFLSIHTLYFSPQEGFGSFGCFGEDSGRPAQRAKSPRRSDAYLFARSLTARRQGPPPSPASSSMEGE